MGPQPGEISLSGQHTMVPVFRSPQVGTVLNVTLLVGCILVLIAAFVLTPGKEGLSLLGHRWPIGCRLYETFGIRCSLCGMSRSLCSLAHGDIAAGFHFHPLGPLVFALFCLEIPYRLYALAIRPRTLGRILRRLHNGVVLTVFVALLVNWLGYLGGLFL